MNALAPHIQRQLEQYADGELDHAAVREVEAMLSNSASARMYLDAIEELRVLPQIVMEESTADVDFSRLEDSIMQSLFDDAEVSAPSTRRDPVLESLTTQWVDGELHNPRDIQRVFEYLASNPEARDAVEGLRELQRVTRDYAQHASNEVDFNALYARTVAAVGVQETPATAAADSNVVPLQSWIQRFKAPLAAAAGIAAATAIMLPIALNSVSTPSITNNFYGITVDNVDVEPGYSGTIVRGDSKAATVVWFSDDPDNAPTRNAPHTITKDPDEPAPETAPEDDVLDI